VYAPPQSFLVNCGHKKGAIISFLGVLIYKYMIVFVSHPTRHETAISAQLFVE
jgi:hypothetical protein